MLRKKNHPTKIKYKDLFPSQETWVFQYTLVIRTEIGIWDFIFFKLIISPDNVLLWRVNDKDAAYICLDAAYICYHGSGMLHWCYSACYLLIIWIIYPRFNSLHLTCLFRCCTYSLENTYCCIIFFVFLMMIISKCKWLCCMMFLDFLSAHGLD
jgi:hypothetical protein